MRFISRCLARTFLDEHQEPVTDYDEGMVRREASEKLLKMVEEIEASLQ